MKTVSFLLIALMVFCYPVISFSQTPVYNSLPAARATIFLDFDGHFVTGTGWNYNGSITCGPSNLTNEQVTEVFNRVAEDYRPFNVNITTDSTKYWAAPQFQRMRVVVTITSSWYGSAGGVSYVGSFTWGDNTPCFVFSALLGYGTKKVAEASSHEAGHTLGLNHQSSYDGNCTKISEYNPGAGSGDIAWAPIMGYSYSKNLTLWHNGSSTYGCSAYQDDLSLITSSRNGFGYRTDDFSNDASNCGQANFANNKFALNGVIERTTDVDFFKLTIPVHGQFRLDANPYSAGSGFNGSNLDMRIDLLSRSQNILRTFNPDLSLNATIDTVLEQGTYYLRVQSVGNIYAPDYATLGSYSLNGTFLATSILPVHRLDLSGVSEKNVHRLNWLIEADETVTDQTLESSVDGKTFYAVSTVNPVLRSYSNAFSNNRKIYYRLKVNFNDNKEYYSNVVALEGTNLKPSVTNTLARHSVIVNSPSVFTYTVVDYHGKPLAKGRVIQGTNTIPVYGMTNGMYMIQFDNGQQQFTERFLKQ